MKYCSQKYKKNLVCSKRYTFLCKFAVLLCLGEDYALPREHVHCYLDNA